MTYEIGKIYRVPCARLVSQYPRDTRIVWVPVIGPEHSDPEIGASETHIHIDTRFVKRQLPNAEINRYGTTKGAVFTRLGDRSWWVVTGIYPRLRRCHRTHTAIHLNSTGVGAPTKYLEWLPKMIDKPCRGKRCPHRGTEMQDCNGLLLCPLHNLVGDPATERIIGAYSGEGKVCRKKLLPTLDH